MKIDLDAHQICYYLEGCARGSHLRQGCWLDMIRLYPKMRHSYRSTIYKIAKQDIAPIFDSHDPADGLRPAGAYDFDKFIACFNPDNRYIVTGEKDGTTETRDAYLYQGRYYTGDYTFFDEKYITKVEKV